MQARELTQNQEMVLNQLSIIMEKLFLRTFISNLMDKPLIDQSIKDRESVHVPPNDIHPSKNQYIGIKECEQKKIFTPTGEINRPACHEHSVKIDEKRINLSDLYHLNSNIKLSCRENLILDAVLSCTHNQVISTFQLSDIYDDMLPDLTEDEKMLIAEKYVRMIQDIPKKIIKQFTNIGLKGAPWYEPTEKFKISIYFNLFKLDVFNYLEDCIQTDAEKLFHFNKVNNEGLSVSELYDLTTTSLFLKYDFWLKKLKEEGNHSKSAELRKLLLQSIDKIHSNEIRESDKNKTCPPKPEALRLIHRGEGLVKMLNPLFIKFSEILRHNDNQQWVKEVKEVDQKWEFTFDQLLDPMTNRPKRQVLPEPLNGFCFSPLLQMQVRPDELEVKSLDHTVMTSSTLLPADGKMRLFGASNFHAIGLLFDIRMCDLVGEHFVFDTDTYTVNDWWHNPNAVRYHNQFKGYTVNQLIGTQHLHEEVEYIRDYNEIMAGVNAAGLAAILFEPAVDVNHSNVKDMNYYEERLNLIYRKIYVAAMIGRHLPLIIFDAHHGTYQYTLDEQRADLIKISRDFPSHSLLKALLSAFDQLCEQIPEECEFKIKPNIGTDSISMLERKKNLKMDIFKLQNEIDELVKKIFALQGKQALHAAQQTNSFFNEIDNSFKTTKDLSIDLIEDKTEKINDLLNQFRQIATYVEYNIVADFIENQNQVINKQGKERSLEFQSIIMNVRENAADEKALPCLFNMAKDPGYTGQNDQILSMIEKRKGFIKNRILAEIKKDYPPVYEGICNSNSFSFFSSALSLLTNQAENDETRHHKLISKAMAEFEQNIKFNPAINDLTQLINTQIRRDNIQIRLRAIHMLRQAIKDLVTPDVQVSQFSTHVVPKYYDPQVVTSYQLLIKHLSSLDPDLSLNEFFNKHSRKLNINYEDEVIIKLIKLATSSLFIPGFEGMSTSHSPGYKRSS